MKIRALIASVVLVVSASAHAFSANLQADLPGKWKSIKVYSKISSDPTAGQFTIDYQFEFGLVDFSMTQTMTYKNGAVAVTKYSGVYGIIGDRIVSVATTITMSNPKETLTAPLKHGSGSIFSVEAAGADASGTDTMTLALDSLYVDLERVP